MIKEKSPEFEYAKAYHEYAEKYLVYKESINRLLELTQNFTESDPTSILDIGAGTGMTLKVIRNNYPQTKITCVDSSKNMLQIAKGEVGGNNYEFVETKAEEVDKVLKGKYDLAFCNAAFWYFDREKALDAISRVLKKEALFAFNISEPAINFEDGNYDDRFLQTMDEELEKYGIVYHRADGVGTGRLRLSYKPPTIKDIEKSLSESGFMIIRTRIWEFTKNLDELTEFYMIPGFGIKAFRELTDLNFKRKLLDQVATRLKKEGVLEINFRWAEFVAIKK